MCGNSPDYPDPVDPMREAEAQIQIRQEEARLAQEQADRQRALAAEDEQQRVNQFNTALGSGYNSALQYATRRAGDYGLDSQQFLPRIQSQLNYIRGSANPYYTADPTQLFDDSVINDLFSQEQDRLRRQYGNQVNEIAPTGFARTAIPSTADDAIINQILSEQQGNVEQQLFRKFQQGQLTEPAYNFAQQQLGNISKGANAELQDIGSGILEQGRGSLRDLAQEARTGAQNFQLGNTFDPSLYGDLFSSITNDFTNNLEGKLRSAVGNQQFFDINDILARAGSYQGAQNTPNVSATNSPGVPAPQTGPVNPLLGQAPVFSIPQQQQQQPSGIAAALAAREGDSTRKKTASRGLGSKGVF